jgi:hypothetical protein
MELDTVAKWFILIIIFVFDPLAVALVLAYNVMVARDEKEESVPRKTIDEHPITNGSNTQLKSGESHTQTELVLGEADKKKV